MMTINLLRPRVVYDDGLCFFRGLLLAILIAVPGWLVLIALVW